MKPMFIEQAILIAVSVEIMPTTRNIDTGDTGTGTWSSTGVSIAGVWDELERTKTEELARGFS